MTTTKSKHRGLMRAGLAGGAALLVAAVTVTPSISAPPPRQLPPQANAATQRQVSLDEAMTTPTKVSQVSQGRGAVRVGEVHERNAARTQERQARKESTAKLIPSKKVAAAEVFDTESAKAGGCVIEYGQAGQCLPTQPSAKIARHHHGTTTWTCSLVRETFPDGLKLRMPPADPLGLDTNRDGLACGPGDRA